MLKLFRNVSAMLGCIAMTLFLFTASAGEAKAQSGQTISGRVVDSQGAPLAGVAVQDLAGKTYAITDADGQYSIKVASLAKARLEFTMLGMETLAIDAAGKAKIDITMQESREFLDEVVVTGYQDLQRGKVTGAIATVSSQKLEERFNTSITSNLEGKVAGLSTYGGKLTIRGASSMYGDTNPLLVVDGLPVESSLDDLNPYDVESINVLKDASAAAIYGARASNGIIVITTKNAKEKNKVDIDFSANLVMYEKKNTDYSDNFYMTAEQQVKLDRDYYQYQYFDSPTAASNIASMASTISAGTSYISPIHYAYYQMALGQKTSTEVDQLCNELSQNNFAKEFADAVYKRQIIQQYNLAIRHASEKAQNNVVLNYKYDNSGVINSGMQQFNISYKGSFDIAKWLTASVGINGIYETSQEKGYDYNGFGDMFDYPAYETMYNSDGSYKKAYTWYNGNAYWDGGGSQYKDTGINIVDEYYNNVQQTKRQYMRYNGELLFKIIDGLTASAQFVYEMDHKTVDWNIAEGSHVNNTLYNAFMDYQGGEYVSLYPSTGGYRNTKNSDGRYWTARGQVNYSKKFGKHEIVALIGTEFRETLTKGTQSLMLGYSDQLQTASTQTMDLAAMSMMTYNSYYMNSGYYGFPTNQFAYSPYIEDGMTPITEIQHRYASAYANLTYTYDEKYNVFGSFRKDYADVYGLNVKLRGKPLWSAGAAWNMNKEDFLSDVHWVNALKLRFSYGVTGNIYQGATSYMTAAVMGLSRYAKESYAEIESPANPELKWEKTETINAGVDFAFVNNRFRGTIDYYHKKGMDLFSYKTLDPATGFSSMFMNSADMVNNGIELTFTGDWFRERKRNDFSWTTTLTFAYNNNKITNVENDATMAYQLIETPYKVGYPTSAMWSYQFAGISDEAGSEGETRYYGNGGTLVHHPASQGVDVLEYSGQQDPSITAGMDNRFAWNGISLSIMMAYYGGHKMWCLQENETFGVYEGSAVPSYFLNAWTPENPTDTPGIGRYSSSSTSSSALTSNKFVQDASFLKIRNIVLGYEFSEKIARKIGADRLNLQVQLDNPAAIWTANKVNVDPETLGIRNLSSYTFGLHINF